MPPEPRPRPPRRALSRRRVIAGALSGAGLLGAGFAASGGTDLLRAVGRDDPTRSVTVAYTSATERTGIDAEAAARLPAGSRVMPELSDTGPDRRQQEFLDRCRPWVESLPMHRRELATSALLDLWVLSDSLPGTVASWTGPWRCIWPRDTAFSAIALARVGGIDLAWSHLLHLQSLQDADGSFAARYLPETGGVPDDRATQSDAIGLLLWAVAEVADSAARNGRPVNLEDMAPMLRRSSSRLISHTSHGTRLPPVSPDYWEVAESRVTLGIAGPTLIGLQSLLELAESSPQIFAGSAGGVAGLEEAADGFRETFARTFTANGLQRYPSSGGLDSALSYLPAAGLVAGRRAHGRGARADLALGIADLDRARRLLEQPAGGIRPGHGWILDRSSWTPSTSLMALGYARLGAVETAEEMLDWLSEHRTGPGSLPEKVSEDGVPVSVAPLSWTASNVVICLDELYGGT
ncbi:hypothetical protein ACH82I_02760 [Brevibacterium sp. GP-SGM9]|uniref:hypothetical protein n=1 Tax=Brevibacterium sp. GP-SGM9 TaxID=3376990 RepID=UPI0039A60678